MKSKNKRMIGRFNSANGERENEFWRVDWERMLRREIKDRTLVDCQSVE